MMTLRGQKKYKIIYSIIFLALFIFTQQLFPQADFTIIGLPDTQYYSENAQGSGSGKGSGDIATFIAQTEWIVANKDILNIVYVAHLGDCVENGDTGELLHPGDPTNQQEWIRAADAMSRLENPSTTGLTYGIPFGIAVGNHDISPWGGPGTTTLYNQYFGISHFSGRDYYAGHYGSDNDNHYDLFEVGSLKFIVIYIEYGSYTDDPPVLSWANNLLATYNDRYGIVVSHKILNSDATFSTQGQAMFDSVYNNANVFLMLCGHVPTPDGAHRTDLNGSGNGRNIYTILTDFQNLSNGGDGWLRILRVSPSDNKIYVTTYSPTLDANKTGSNSQFNLDYNFTDPFPVELAFFTGSVNGDNVELRWRTETEVNNYGFDIERSIEKTNWLKIGFVEGQGNSNSPKQYEFIDSDIYQATTYYYRLKQIDNDGTNEYSNIIAVEVGLPNSFILSQNYPNPFNPETRIDFKISEKQLVTIRVYNSLGEQVAELVNEEREAGSYSVTFDGSNLPSGVYIYRLNTSSYAENKKMILLK